MARYFHIDNPIRKTCFDKFLRRLKVLGIAVFRPVLLAVMNRAGSDQVDLDGVAESLESYSVRRAVCGYQTKGYGGLARSLLKEISSAPVNQPIAEVVRGYLGGQSASSYMWPTDSMFRSEWIRRRFYGGMRRERVAMILQALEDAYMREAYLRSELPLVDFSKLHIEHIMPQRWREEYWPLEIGSSANERELMIHSIGNLTLVPNLHSPPSPNLPWQYKRRQLEWASALQLNRRLLQASGQWTDASIVRRAEELFEKARVIWPEYRQP